VKDFDVFDIKEKWFKEAAPQNYSSGSTAGVPARTPSIVMDKANDALYVCAKADPTIYNTGWKKYVVDGGGGGGTDYEFTLSVDEQMTPFITPDPSGVTFKNDDKVKLTLSDDIVGLLEMSGMTVTQTEITTTAAPLSSSVVINADTSPYTIGSGVIAVLFAPIATSLTADIDIIIFNSGQSGSTMQFTTATKHEITVTCQYNSEIEAYELIPLQGYTTVSSSLDTATVDISDDLKTVLTSSGMIIDHDTFSVTGSVSSSNITIDTTAPSKSGYTFTIGSGSIYFDMGEFAHASDNSIVLNGYIGIKKGTNNSYQPGVIINQTT